MVRWMVPGVRLSISEHLSRLASRHVVVLKIEHLRLPYSLKLTVNLKTKQFLSNFAKMRYHMLHNDNKTKILPTSLGLVGLVIC